MSIDPSPAPTLSTAEPARSQSGTSSRAGTPGTIHQHMRLWAIAAAVLAVSGVGGTLLTASLLAEDILPGVDGGSAPETREMAGPAADASGATVVEAEAPARLASRVTVPPVASPDAAGTLAPASDAPAIDADDPRWAREVVARPNVVPELAERLAAMQAFADDDRTATPDLLDAALAPDPERTAAVPPPAPVATTSRAPTGVGRTTSAVNLRAGPDNKSAVLTTLPSGAEVQLVACDVWCEVVYRERRGYVFSEFVRQGGATARTKSAGPKPTADPADADAPAAETPPVETAVVPAADTPEQSPQPATMRTDNRGR